MRFFASYYIQHTETLYKCTYAVRQFMGEITTKNFWATHPAYACIRWIVLLTLTKSQRNLQLHYDEPLKKKYL